MKTVISGVTIKSISACVPQNKVDLASFYDIFGEKEVQRIVASSGISSIRVATQSETTSDMCVKASEIVLEKRDRASIGAIVFVSQTPDYILPATAATLQNRLDLPKSVVTYDVCSGCTGYIHGLFLSAMLSSSMSCDVLLCTGDTISKHISDQDRSLRLIMGDAGTASIIGPAADKEMFFRFFTDGSRYSSLIIPAGGARDPYNEKNASVTERENGNSRSDRHLFMDGMEIMKFALSDVARLVGQSMKDEREEIDIYAFHQANKFIVDALSKNLKLDKEKVLLAVDGYGNTGPASIPVALCHCLANSEKNINHRGKGLFAGFGVGLSAGTAVVDLAECDICPVVESDRH